MVHTRAACTTAPTKRIHLQPFDLHETERFSHKSKTSRSTAPNPPNLYGDGRHPHYLKEVGEDGKKRPCKTLKICFRAQGCLTDEFKKLYPALFGKIPENISPCTALAPKMEGLTRRENSSGHRWRMAVA
ncbi:MAG: hypothetical protein IPN76_02490 [Saprospiraceae bacterium]|nr:hypothetical protein [Saprospiraceae bacterium]